ncbi:MAG: hypothetical protein IBX64_08165 [Actinobacteria bacterium]|nr:hypothetical protein [Actinomycetota bacterium]
MLKGRQRTSRSKANSWKTWGSIAAEGRRVNRQVSRDSRQIVARTEELIALITDVTAA